MQEIIISTVCIVTVVGVLVYILFSKPKALKPKRSNEKTFLNVDVTWGGEDAKEVYESLRNSKTRPKFKGNHRLN